MIRQNELDAGFDLVAEHSGIVTNQGTTEFRTGVYGCVPPGSVGFVVGRSGLGIKHNVRLSNIVGVIDAGYTGEVIVGLIKDTEGPYRVTEGERIAQIVFLPLSAFNPHASSDRGDDGFGSTGRA